MKHSVSLCHKNRSSGRKMFELLVPEQQQSANLDSRNTSLQQFADFILQCLAIEPGRRLTAQQALNDPFIKRS